MKFYSAPVTMTIVCVAVFQLMSTASAQNLPSFCYGDEYQLKLKAPTENATSEQ